MKRILYLLTTAALLLIANGCNDLDIEPRNIVNDEVALGTKNGSDAYMATIYSMLPVDDFKSSWASNNAFNTWQNFNHWDGLTGDLVNDKIRGAKNGATGYWADAYKIIRAANYLLENLPAYKDGHQEEYYHYLMGEAYFIRAYAYFSLVKRYGGVPIIKIAQKIGEQTLEELQVPRSTEDVCYDFMKEDLDSAIARMSPILETSTKIPKSRGSKYAAAAFKSRVMLYAGSIALANDLRNSGLCGIRQERAEGYFKEAYEASKIVEEGGFQLYRAHADKKQNYIELFYDKGSVENLFIKEYYYPDAVHSYDAIFVPAQYRGSDGYGLRACPTMEFVELFDGFPKEDAGGATYSSLQIVSTTKNGNFIQYDNITDLFKDAEPRLKATVLLPGEEFKGEAVDFRRGLYVGPIENDGNIKAVDLTTTANASRTLKSNARAANLTTSYELPDGRKITYSGLSGPFKDQSGTMTGFAVRKYLDPKKSVAQVLLHHSDQHFIEIRYAEVLLNRAEAAFELYKLNSINENGVDYLQDAYLCINDIRDRAGSTLLTDKESLDGNGPYDGRRQIRVERRKELAFEYKLWWDFKRWRRCLSTQNEDEDLYMNNTRKGMLSPYYVPSTGKYFFHRKNPMESACTFTFKQSWYYEPIPQEQINMNPNLIKNDD